MAVKSKILLDEAIKNKEKKTKGDELYYQVYIDNGKGVEPALFTQNQISVAMKRAKRNPEDIGQQAIELKSERWYSKIFSMG